MGIPPRPFNNRLNLGGHYDDHGNWKRTKHCARSCGKRCDCGPPNGEYYSAKYDQREPPGNLAAGSIPLLPK